ncbi:MATE family efflux transporter [uncultured Bacteroides sp.]|uniref:MATE family efflux transporter n=1 Tax=uncultured Bacteroides sp. TaxID=162156 RepID=UPI00262418B8|nr:MATE family efflux transporter [uncultured Bacteroides sp.]
MKSSNKTIAKNTIFLYFRMLFTMIVSLYTSRVILQKLGVDDYGIYQSVGGIVGFLSFINSALSTGSSRFLTYELGRENFQQLKRTFSTTLTIHIVIAFFIVLIAETFGYWFLENKLVISPERIGAAKFVFHISILTAVFALTQVPYNASIISHEKMSVFAYMSILEVSAKLGIVYLLSIGNWDKLKLYSILLFLVQITLMIIYRIYCRIHFNETKYQFIFDKKIFKQIASFSGWSLFANASYALNSQGILILLNMFFAPAVVTARSISIQINMAALQFINNFRTAVNPQIVKRLAAGNTDGSKELLLSSTKFSYYLMFMICFPICLYTYPILKLWLGVVPEYTVIFVQLIIVQSLFQVFDTSFYTALYAQGRVKENALISPVLGLIRFPLIYFMFRAGFSPVVLSWASLITYMILGLFIKPFLITKYAGYNWKDILKVFYPCVYTTLVAIPIPIIIVLTIPINNLFFLFLNLFSTLIITLISVWFVGIDKALKHKIKYYVQQKIHR